MTRINTGSQPSTGLSVIKRISAAVSDKEAAAATGEEWIKVSK